MTLIIVLLLIVAGIIAWQSARRKKSAAIEAGAVRLVQAGAELQSQRKRYPHLIGNSHQRRVQRRANIRKGEQ